MEGLRKHIILLVEDDPGDQKLISRALNGDDIIEKLQIADCAEDALSYLEISKKNENTKPMPELILLDLNMPGMGGREFLKIIKADYQLKQIPVVVLTTSDAKIDVEKSYELNVAGYIRKPNDIKMYKQIINTLKKYWFATTKLSHV